MQDETVFDDAQPTNDGDKRLHVRFFMSSVEDEAESVKAGRPIYKDVPFVEIHTPGDKTTVIKTEAWIHHRHPMAHNNRFPKQWLAFKANGDQAAVSGTPLDRLPGITEGQVRELAYFGARTVEQLAEMPDSNLGNFMGGNLLKQRAQAWLEAAKGNAPMEAMRVELAKRDAEMAAMKEQIAALSAEPPKRGPGRPPKEQ